MNKTILLTGGTGLIGQALTQLLLLKGYHIHLLSRKDEQPENPKIKTFKWDVYKRQTDLECLDGVEAIIHLAGEGIADKRWAEKRKQQIIESRTESIRLIYELLKNKDTHTVKAVISASATGYYSDRGDELLTEESKPAHDFLAHSCVEGEKAVDEGAELGLRIVKLRTGIVLDKRGGALVQIAGPVKLGFGAVLGSGKQWMSWIHIEDAIRMYEFALENKELSGVFNMVSPEPATNKELTKAIAAQLHKPLWLPHVPAFALKLVMGEMATIVLGSTKVSANKIQSADFQFKHPNLKDALKNIYG
ncbi:MAG: TIGR01777 family oxidoreductase [Daejeonella sp.]